MFIVYRMYSKAQNGNQLVKDGRITNRPELVRFVVYHKFCQIRELC